MLLALMVLTATAAAQEAEVGTTAAGVGAREGKALAEEPDVAASKTSNYQNQAKSVPYVGEGLPQSGILNGTVTELDPISSTISLNRTMAFLNCSAGFMSVRMRFRTPFHGIVFAFNDQRNR